MPSHRFIQTTLFRGLLPVIGAVLILITTGNPSGWGQEQTILDRELRFEDERVIEILEDTEWRIPPAVPGIQYDWGGWLSTNFYRFDEFDRTAAQADSIEGAFTWDLRFWTKVFFMERHSFYFRFKNQFASTDWGGGFSGREKTDNDGPHVDLAYFSFNFPRELSAKIGRQYFRLGRGLVLSNVLDGLKINKRFKKTAVKTYLAITRPHENNFDTSIPGWDLSSRRLFAALCGEYRMTSGRRFYGYFLLEEDRSEEVPDDPNQTYDYDASYLGFGADGHVSRTFTYWSEAVFQRGESPVSVSNSTVKVRAAAFALGAMWVPEVKLHPTLSLEMYSGSGDYERGHVTNSIGGKTTNSTDKGFLHFSTPSLGLAFTPRLANLRVLKAAFSFKPFERNQAANDLMVSVIGSRFRKRKHQGAISDLMASEGSKDVGNEFDLYLTWKALSDISTSLSWGRFTPGSAYPTTSRNKTTYLNLSLSYSF
ncbi:MAG: alginate export family protein [bacterium]|nr:alginate export family protein [bacterium]